MMIDPAARSLRVGRKSASEFKKESGAEMDCLSAARLRRCDAGPVTRVGRLDGPGSVKIEQMRAPLGVPNQDYRRYSRATTIRARRIE